MDRSEEAKNLNPFATDEDDDSDGEGDFTIGDLEAEEEGKGHLPPGTGLVGNEESLNHLLPDEKNVGVPFDSSVVSSTSFLGSGVKAQTSFPTMWPFGGPVRNGEERGDIWRGDDNDRSHFRGANADDDSQSSEEDSDDEYGSGKFGDDGQGRRRLSATTAAKRRTSLEDDDDEDEVVHVGMAEATSEADSGKLVGEGDDELVEIQHAETRVDGESTK